MTMRRGRCNNLGLCDNAVRQRTIEVAENEPFVCPKCGTELVSITDRPSTRKASSLALPMAAIALALAGVGYKVWDMYGHPAPAAVQEDAPAPAGTAATPAPAASVPVPDAAAPASPPATAVPPAQAAPEPAAPAAVVPAPAADTPPAPASAAPPTPAPAAPAPGSASPAAPPKQPDATPAPSSEPASVAPAPALPVVTPAPVQGAAIATPPPPAPEAVPAPAAPAPAASDAAARVRAFLGSAVRVPVTLTFRSSVVTLGGRADHDLERAIAYLRQHHATGDRVYLAGFTDNQGDAASNAAVAQKRVAAVAAALAQAGIAPGHVASFGSDLPVADNATVTGRDRNRRVEIYLAP